MKCPYHNLESVDSGNKHIACGGRLFTCPKGCYFCECEIKKGEEWMKKKSEDENELMKKFRDQSYPESEDEWEENKK